MVENDPDFKENIKKSFNKVKEDINDIKEINLTNKTEINEIKDKISLLNEKIGNLELLFKNEAKNTTFSLKSSIGNKGVVNDQQQSTMINNNQQSTTMSNLQQPSTISSSENAGNLLDPQFVKRIRDLTDREYSLFIKIYELNSLKEEISYSELANQLKLTEGTIRGVVTRIIAKGLPLIKERFFNKKSSLFIDPDFFKPFLLPELMKLRYSSMQKTLRDRFQ